MVRDSAQQLTNSKGARPLISYAAVVSTCCLDTAHTPTLLAPYFCTSRELKQNGVTSSRERLSSCVNLVLFQVPGSGCVRVSSRVFLTR
jgi:hypothetical protein